MGKDSLVFRLIRVVAGLVLFALGLHLMVRANIGLAPWEALSMGLSEHIGLTYGRTIQIVGVIIVGIDLLIREKIGLGTLIDALEVGFVLDLLEAWSPLPMCQSIWSSCAMAVAAMFVLGLGEMVYMSGGLSCGPRDALMVGVGRWLRKYPISVARCLLQGTVVILALLIGGPIGVGTFLFAFGSGPISQIVYDLFRFEPRDVEHEGIIESLQRLRRLGSAK